jgi:hypothetical protein
LRHQWLGVSKKLFPQLTNKISQQVETRSSVGLVLAGTEAASTQFLLMSEVISET